MADERQRVTRKAVSVREKQTGGEPVSRTSKKARSLRDESHRSPNTKKPERQTIYLNTENADPDSSQEKSSASSPLARLKAKYRDAKGAGPATGSTYKRKQAQQAARNDLLKKGLIGLIAIVVLVLIILLIVNAVQVKDVGPVSIESTATTQTLKWSGARKGLTYEVYRAEGATGQFTLVDTLTEGENSRTYDNLTSGALYRYNIVTVRSNGEKTEGRTAQAYTKPNAVTGTSASSMSDHGLTARWSLQGKTAEYELKYSLYDNMRDPTLLTFTSDQTQYSSGTGTYSYTIPDLVLDETYFITIRTICEDSASEWCAIFSGTVSESADLAGLDLEAPMVALTFDSGPDAGTVTTRILDKLAEYNGHATFFQTGENATAHPALMQRMVREKHEIGNHTYDNSHVGGDLTADDILNANTAIQAVCGVSPKLFRSPEGLITEAMLNTCTDAGMAIVLWNFDSRDWATYEPTEIIERIESYVEDGDIIQFRNIYDETADAMDELIPWLVDQGYQLVTVTQMVQAKTESLPIPGKIYRSADDVE